MKKALILAASAVALVACAMITNPVQAVQAASTTTTATIATTTQVIGDFNTVPPTQLDATGKVVVKDVNGNPVVGAPVKVELVDGYSYPQDVKYGTTDSKGEYRYSLYTGNFGFFEIYATTSAFNQYLGSKGQTSIEFPY